MKTCIVDSRGGGGTVPTQSRSVQDVRIVLGKVPGLVWGEESGLDEADQGVDLLEVVLDRSPRQQNLESHRELVGPPEPPEPHPDGGEGGWEKKKQQSNEEDDDDEEMVKKT